MLVAALGHPREGERLSRCSPLLVWPCPPGVHLGPWGTSGPTLAASDARLGLRRCWACAASCWALLGAPRGSGSHTGSPLSYLLSQPPVVAFCHCQDEGKAQADLCCLVWIRSPGLFYTQEDIFLKEVVGGGKACTEAEGVDGLQPLWKPWVAENCPR